MSHKTKPVQKSDDTPQREISTIIPEHRVQIEKLERPDDWPPPKEDDKKGGK